MDMMYVMQGCQVCKNDKDLMDVKFFDPEVFNNYDVARNTFKYKYYERLKSGDVLFSEFKNRYFKIVFARGEVVESYSFDSIVVK